MNDSAPLPDNDKIMADVEQDQQPISVRDRTLSPLSQHGYNTAE